MAAKSEEEKHLEIMLAIKEINTTIEILVEPAVKQTYVNKDKIIILERDAKNSTDGRGRLIGYASLFISMAVAIMSYLRLSKIH